MTRLAWLATFLFLTVPFIPSGGARAADAPAAKPEDVGLFGIGIRASDFDKSLKFYTEGLGLVLARKPSAEANEALLSMPGNSGAPLILLQRAPAGPLVMGNAFARIVFTVNDAQALSTRLKKAGYAPTDIKEAHTDVKVFTVKDPDGYQVELTQMKPWKKD